ncbi:MAG TPA: hypothetical protein VMC80_02760 [Patescibacteria group bacterium]|nr:hypothetical protein [Patescibacteria group bacterium]
MPDLKRLKGKPTTLKVYGVIEAEKIYPSKREIAVSGTRLKPEYRYYFHISKTDIRLPVYHSGERKVIMEEGGLVQLTQ